MKEKSSEFSPGGVECATGHCEAGRATSADEVPRILLAGEERFEGVVRRKLYHAYHSFCIACWAKPMGWISVCGGFLQYVGGKARSKRLQLIAAEIRFGLLELEKFLFERVTFHRHSLMLLCESEICRLVVNELLLNTENCGVDVAVLRETASCVNRLKEHIEGCRRVCRSGNYRRNIKHCLDPLWSVNHSMIIA